MNGNYEIKIKPLSDWVFEGGEHAVFPNMKKGDTIAFNVAAPTPEAALGWLRKNVNAYKYDVVGDPVKTDDLPEYD